MLDFVIKYWVQFLFGLAAMCFTFIIKQYYVMKDKIKQQELQELKENMCASMKTSIYEKINEEHALSAQGDEAIRVDIEIIQNSIEHLSRGILSLQGKEFKDECRRLLEPEHEITVEEYENIVDEHETYHGLGGNHRGDALFKSVMKKWNRQLNPESFVE